MIRKKLLEKDIAIMIIMIAISFKVSAHSHKNDTILLELTEKIGNRNNNVESKTEIDTTYFETFISNFLIQTCSGKNFDSLVFVSSPLITKFIETKNIGFGRFYNMGAYCNLYSNNRFGYNFYEGNFGSPLPDISGLSYFSRKEPVGGFCEEATSPDGIYYKEVAELPNHWDMVNMVSVPAPEKYKNLRKIKVNIQFERMIIKSLYFIEYNSQWYLLYINDCDCSA